MQNTILTPAEKIASACSSIVVAYPFYAPFVLTRNIVEGTDEQMAPHYTMMTDGRTIWWHKKFVDGLSVPEVIGVLLHEVLHIVLKHHLRRDGRRPDKWNTACDYVIDPIVLSGGNKLPTGPGLEHHHDRRYDGKSAEQVYALLPDQDKYRSGIGVVLDMRNEDGSQMSAAEIEMADLAVDQLAIVAAEAAKARGKLPAGLAEYIERLREPKVDWQSVLRRFVGGDFPENYNTRRPSRPMLHLYDMIEPSLEKTGAGHLVLAIDTSASVSNTDLAQFISEINAISEEMAPERVTVIQCDARVQSVQEYGRGEVIDNRDIRISGRGGTAVQPVFQYVRDHVEKVDRLIYFTDMEIGDWGDAPEYPVLWASTSPTTRGPYGETVHVRVSEGK